MCHYSPISLPIKALCADSLDLSRSPARVLSLLSVREIFAPNAVILFENARLEGEGDFEVLRSVIVMEVCCWWWGMKLECGS
jgi:hypothetical protein